MNKSVLCASIGLLVSQAITPVESQATTLSFSLEGWFTMLNTSGSPLANSSISVRSGTNNYQTPITGTLQYDPDSGAGLMTIAPFDWGGNPPATPFTFRDITMQHVRSGDYGSNSLMLGNMLYDWNSDNDIPVSIVWDAAGLLDAITQGLNTGDTISGSGAVPASDGSYVPYNGGSYLNLGPSPLATATWNTTNAPGCELFQCAGRNPSGLLPLLVDDARNDNFSSIQGTDVYGIGGSPLMEGGYNQKHLNLDFTRMTFTAIDNQASIAAHDITAVPAPAAFWLLGSGLLVLSGVRRNRTGNAGLRTNLC